MSTVGDMLGRLEKAAGDIGGHAASVGDSSGDVLAAAISEFAQHYGQALSERGLRSGISLSDGRLPIEHIETAAARAGLSVERATADMGRLALSDLPVLALAKDGGALIIWQIRETDEPSTRTATCSWPGSTRGRIECPLPEICDLVTGSIIRMRPRSALDERAQDTASDSKERWFRFAFRGLGRVYAKAIAATVAVNILALALPLFTMNVYDRVLPNAVEETLWALAIGAMIAVLFDFLIRTLRARLVDTASRRADVLLANFIFGRLIGARTPEKPVSAGIRANALREFETLREFLNSATLTVFGDLPFLVLFLMVIAVVAGELVIVPLVAIPIVLTVAWLHQRVLTRLSEAAFKESAQKNAVIVETVVGLESVKAAGAESWAATKWETAIAEHVRTGFGIRNVSNVGFGAVQALQTLTQIVIIIAGFYLVSAGSMTMGALIAATMLAGRALQPLGQLAMLIARLHQVRLAYRALSEIVEAPQERPDGTQLISKSRFDGRLQFEQVSFHYESDGPAVLREISFDIAPGERVGIVGGIGAGKTTILKLLQAHYAPACGRVLIDGIQAGHLDPTLLRSNVGLALQDADLFHGTIRSNIALSDPGARDEDVLRAAQACGAMDWIVRCPKGFDTPVRERGAGLSGGQRQSVALARALFSRPRILLLDEPTSDMDTRTEQNVVAALRQFVKGRTLVAVSHRPALLALVDRLIVLEAGRMLLDGPKATVLKDLEALNVKRVQGAHARAAPQAKEGAA